MGVLACMVTVLLLLLTTSGSRYSVAIIPVVCFLVAVLFLMLTFSCLNRWLQAIMLGSLLGKPTRNHAVLGNTLAWGKTFHLVVFLSHPFPLFMCRLVGPYSVDGHCW